MFITYLRFGRRFASSYAKRFLPYRIIMLDKMFSGYFSTYDAYARYSLLI